MQDAKVVEVGVLVASGGRALKNMELGCNIDLTLSPDSQLTFCASGTSDTWDAQDARYFLC